ncbi:MAG: C-GCAxxG-C-C family protein [Lachnospiraceae bacterium]|nr:C-GCAxxG-C-C family protein [Lachnospiraceae bacterium]MDD7024355.1 C-GCAxxG-C-C family protein [Oscillospiraceae bacterium]MDY5541444.1 C-GCAxxG-C-C family protein [Lachnospiraceae bacterium]MDY5648437.1 C-GCAxxG-C-C family protein [Lachnospiraceae bacterium]
MGDIMEKRIEAAMDYHKRGFNCAQAVACAFCDKAGVDEETMFRLTEGFGLGMGGMKGTCGAVSGAVLLAGLANSTGNTEKPDSKGSTYKLSKALVREFLEKNQSVVCEELKGVETGNVLRSCNGCIKDAVILAGKILYGEE